MRCGCCWMCIARFGSTATACVDQTEDLSPQSSPFRASWIGKDVRNKRVSDRVLFPSPAPTEFKHLRQPCGAGAVVSGAGAPADRVPTARIRPPRREGRARCPRPAAASSRPPRRPRWSCTNPRGAAGSARRAGNSRHRPARPSPSPPLRSRWRPRRCVRSGRGSRPAAARRRRPGAAPEGQVSAGRRGDGPPGRAAARRPGSAARRPCARAGCG